MEIGELAYAVETNRGFEDAVVAVLKSAESKGWAIFQVYDIKERLAAKGFQQQKIKIIEICSGKFADRLLNKNRLVSICLPCRINVIEDDGKVRIVAARPSIIPQLFPNIEEKDVEDIEKEIMGIVDDSV